MEAVRVCLWVSVGLVGGKQRCVDRLHAGGAGEGSHQPVVDTVHVVNVHAGQEPNGVSIYKVHHTDHTSVEVKRDTGSNQSNHKL